MYSRPCEAELLSTTPNTLLAMHSFVVRIYYGPYLKAESENPIGERAVLKILLWLNMKISHKIIA